MDVARNDYWRVAVTVMARRSRPSWQPHHTAPDIRFGVRLAGVRSGVYQYARIRAAERFHTGRLNPHWHRRERARSSSRSAPSRVRGHGPAWDEWIAAQRTAERGEQPSAGRR